jgi:hypothetical protein
LSETRPRDKQLQNLKEHAMTRLTKCLAAVAVIGGMGLTAQTASAQVKVMPTVPGTHLTPFPPKPFPNPGPFPPRPFPPQRIDFDYVVLYKPSFFSGVQVYGRYETRFQAETVARRLELNGFPTRIDRFRDNGWYGW